MIWCVANSAQECEKWGIHFVKVLFCWIISVKQFFNGKCRTSKNLQHHHWLVKIKLIEQMISKPTLKIELTSAVVNLSSFRGNESANGRSDDMLRSHERFSEQSASFVWNSSTAGLYGWMGWRGSSKGGHSHTDSSASLIIFKPCKCN